MQNRIQGIITSAPRKKCRAPQAAVCVAILLLLGVGNSFFVYAAPEAIESAVISGIESASPAEAQATADRSENPAPDTDAARYVSPVSGYSFSAGDDHGSDLVYYIPVGTPVSGIASGVVAEVQEVHDLQGSFFMGNCVVVENARGERIYYGHLKEALVKIGDAVDAGSPIGISGHTGNAAANGQLTVCAVDKNGGNMTAAIKQSLR